MRQLYVRSLILLIVFAIGCKRQVATPPPVPPPVPSAARQSADEDVAAVPGVERNPSAVVEIESTSKEDTAKEDPAQVDPAEMPPAESDAGGLAESSGEQIAGESQTEPASATAADAVANVAAPEQPHERFLLLTRDGPLVIDVVLRIDKEPYTRALERLVERVFHEVAADGTERPGWAEMIENPKFSYGQFGNLTPEDADQKRQIIEMYDTNRNSLVDRDELPRFLTRNVGGSRSFALRSSNEFRGDNRTRSPVRRLLDGDHDGAITADEMDSAPRRLFERDADDDEILVLADFKDSMEQPQTQMSNQRRVNAPDTAILIGPRTRWGYVSYALQETYAYGERIGADDIPLTAELVERLDENNNRLIDNSEVPKLADVPPHLVLEVEFFDASEATPATPRIRIVSACDALASALDSAHEYSNRLSFDLPGAAVEFFVNEDPSLSNAPQAVNAQFAMLDGDDNGYLDADEYAGQILGFTLPFEALDADGDGMVYQQEVSTLLAQRQAVIRAQIRARAADQEDALFTALDANGDARLTAREIYGAPNLLKALDQNQDAQLQSHEIPGSMAVGFVRGDAQQDNALLVMPAGSRRAGDEHVPEWFAGMDANGDGDISPREFLGSSEKFRQLDSNGDGFISGDEAQSFGA